jgi:hypothetical protein
MVINTEGLKCKNCGYEVMIIMLGGRIKVCHTGDELNRSPSVLCSMVHDGYGASVAELSKDDLLDVILFFG